MEILYILMAAAVIIASGLLSSYGGDRPRRAGTEAIAGFWPGFVISAVIFCAVMADGMWELNISHLIAAVGGMALTILLEERLPGFPWLLSGLAAGTQLGSGAAGAFILVLAMAAMVLTEIAGGNRRELSLNIHASCALMLFAGVLCGSFFKLAVSAAGSLFFAFGAGSMIYTAAGKILPGPRPKFFILLGAALGFFAGLLIY